MTQKVSFLIFVGQAAASPVEQMLATASQAIALDTIEKALSLDACERVIVATDSAAFAHRLALLPASASLPLLVDVDGNDAYDNDSYDNDDEPFHFGSRLRQIIHKYAVERVFYIGGGSAPLLTKEEMSEICRMLSSQHEVVIANNFYSSDFVAFGPGAAIDRIQPPDTDNNLAYSLHHQGGLRVRALARSAGTQMDVDTPTDLTILQLHPGVARHTVDFLRALQLDATNLRDILAVMNDSAAQLFVAGRVGPQAWGYLEASTACQTRVLSEERGMRASGRDVAGRVRSLLGFYLKSQGIPKFFHTLGEFADGALIDSRVIFEHLGLRLTAADRFNSDLLRAEEVQDPLAREFTAAAREAPIPIVLGGHSLVAGGLWALADAALAMRAPGDGLAGFNSSLRQRAAEIVSASFPRANEAETVAQ